jgi:WD40 repeat protein
MIIHLALTDHTDYISFIGQNLDGNLLSCSHDKTVKLWQIETGELLKSIEFEVCVSCIKSLNGDLIAVSFYNGEIQNYNYNKMETVLKKYQQ